jgi:AcrR family transcriptional regulator
MDEKRLSYARGSRREAILGVAQEVFSAEGYAAASMSHIASRLGGSKGTLYNYFRSKEELFAAHVQHQCDCKVGAAFAPPLEGDNPVEILAGLAERVLTAILSDEATAFYSLIVSEAQRTPSVGQAFYENGPRRGVERVAEYLMRAQAEGQILVDDYMAAAEEFLSLVHGGLHWKRVLNVVTKPTPTQIRAQSRRAAETFVRAYGPDMPPRNPA